MSNNEIEISTQQMVGCNTTKQSNVLLKSLGVPMVRDDVLGLMPDPKYNFVFTNNKINNHLLVSWHLAEDGEEAIMEIDA